MKFLELVTRKKEERVANEIPNKFALVLDGWGKGSTHRVGIFASYPWQDTYRTALLSFSPLENEESLTAR